MRYRLIIALLALGTLAGYGSGIASLRYRWHHGSCHEGRRWERSAYMGATPRTDCPPCPSAGSAPGATPQ